MEIANKTVLITGANRGIGRALLDEALRRGAKRVYAGTRNGLDIADPRVTPVDLDVTRAEQIRQAASRVDRLDVLVNNAGIAAFDDLATLELIQRHLDVNLLGLLRVTQAFLPQLKRSRGAIVNVLSLTAVAPMPTLPSYSLSKAAAQSLTQSLRALLAKDGITVHGVIPGVIDTDMTRGIEMPKTSASCVAQAIFDGLDKGQQDIFPDPVSQAVVTGWENGFAKAFERQLAAFVPGGADFATFTPGRRA